MVSGFGDAPEQEGGPGTTEVHDAGRLAPDAASDSAATDDVVTAQADAPIDRPSAFDPDAQVRHGDASPPACPDRIGVGTGSLSAGGATPPSFAEAFNEEVSKLPTPGPFLVVFSGFADAATAKTASFGALAISDKGSDFAASPAKVPCGLTPVRQLEVPSVKASFEMRFVSPASEATIPVVAVQLTGTMANACIALEVASLRLLVPTSAGPIAFHGSTIANLMGAPTAGYDGGSNNAWPIELTGKAKQIYVVPVISSDGGET